MNLRDRIVRAIRHWLPGFNTPGQRLTMLMVVALLAQVSAISVFLYGEFQTKYLEHEELLLEMVTQQARTFQALALWESDRGIDPVEEFDDVVLTFFRSAFGSTGYGFHESGEFVLGRIDVDRVTIYTHDSEFIRSVDAGLTVPMMHGLKGEIGTIIAVDYRGTRVLAAYAPIPDSNWAVVAKMDLSEVRNIGLRSILPGVVASILSIVIVMLFFGKGISQSIAVLAHENALMNHAQQIGNFGYWSYLPDAGTIQVSDQVREILRLERGPTAIDENIYRNMIHKDDVNFVRDKVVEAIESGSDFETVHRVILNDGEVKHVKIQAEHKGPNTYGVIRIEGILQDVSDMVTARKNLELSNELLHRRVFQQTCLREMRDELDGCTDVSLKLPAISEFLNEGLGETLSLLAVITIDGQNYPDVDINSNKSVIPFPIITNSSLRGHVSIYSSKETVDGDTVHLENTINFCENVAHLLRDALEREESVRQASLLESALKSTVDGIIITDPTGKIEWINSSMERITGYSRAELIGMNPQVLKSGVQPKSYYESLWNTITSGRPWKGEFVNRRKSGETYIAQVSITPIFDESETITHYIGVEDDVTRERDTEKQLRRAQKLEAIGTLAGGIAHDFNNLLSAILGYADLALDELDTESQPYRDITEVRVAGERARHLIKQILTFSRSHETEVIALQPYLVVNEALKLLKGTLPATVDLQDDLERSECTIDMDPTQLHQIIMNLVTNAYHALPDEKGTIRVELAGEVVEQARPGVTTMIEPGDYIKLTVEDSGSGIDESIRDSIFDPFFTTKDVNKGTGLGLSTVLGIVQDSGGGIQLESSVDQGTRFEIYLPCSGEGKQAITHERTTAIQGTGQRILVVDDQPQVSELHRRILESNGYRVTAYPDPFEALEAVKAEPDTFALILSDYTMPRMSGLDLVKEIAKFNVSIPVIICSGRTDLIINRPQSGDMKLSCILKPVHLEELLSEVARMVGG